MEQQKGIIKKSEMTTDINYILCPDPTCNSFFESKFLCDGGCPRIKDELIIIKCIGCGEPIELPGDHNMWCRVDHHCDSGNVPGMFQRMSGKYRLIYEKPQEG